MKIVSYNINGIRAVLKKKFLQWLQAVDADVVCLQEVKAMEDQFDMGLFEELGYHFELFPAQRKGYSGVGILSKTSSYEINKGMGLEAYDVEGRIIRKDIGDLSIINTYMPSGASKPERQLYKLQWLHDFYEYVQEVKKERPKLIIAGDFNLCHRPIDIHNPAGLDGFPGFTPEERAWMTGLLELGFVDTFRHLNPQPHQYSWWSYRGGARPKNRGWRIDYILASESLSTQLISARHLTEARHSDHCPVVVEFGLDKSTVKGNGRQ